MFWGMLSSLLWSDGIDAIRARGFPGACPLNQSMRNGPATAIHSGLLNNCDSTGLVQVRWRWRVWGAQR